MIASIIVNVEAHPRSALSRERPQGPSTPPHVAAQPIKASPRRFDIQGLRAICMVQVLLYHAWRIGSPIGVDAFIMISSYLMTSSFVRRSEAGRMPFFLERWANTFKRLLPPLVVTVFATVIASFIILPRSRWVEQAIQGFASVTYWQNWRLVSVAADYYANDSGLASPLQHLWSMSMQGQVFLLWPFLMTLCVLLARRKRHLIRPVVCAAFTLMTVASLMWLLTAAPDDASIYFDTRARIWEFSLGSAIAAAAPWLRHLRPWGRLMSWVGLVVLVIYSLVSIGTYPGPMAAVPMLAVSTILLFPSKSPRSAAAFLSTRPLPNLGDISYAVYLVHWPIFTLTLAALGQHRLTVIEGLLAIAVSIVVAIVLTRAVDDPARKGRWVNARTPNKAIVALASVLAGAVPLAATYWTLHVKAQDDLMNPTDLQNNVVSETHPGATIFDTNSESTYSASDSDATTDGNMQPVVFDEDPLPSPFALDKQWASYSNPCDADGQRLFNTDDGPCRTYAADDQHSEGHILIAGDSHAEQMILAQVSMFLDAAQWNATAVLQGGCSWGMPDSYEGTCQERNQNLLDYMDMHDFDAVMLVSTAASPDSPDESLVSGLEDLVTYLNERGIPVVGVRDNLRSERNLFDCSDSNPTDGTYGGCLLERAAYFPDADPTDQLSSSLDFTQIDMTDQAFCFDQVCPPLIGNISVYLDDDHVTLDYAKTMAPAFSRKASEVLGA